jgi:hypothetical protein
MIQRQRRESLPSVKAATPEISRPLLVAALILRGAFIILLAVTTALVSLPQNEFISTAYETPGDVIRLALGLGLCVWMLYHLFTRPKDPGAYRTWFFFGLVGVPFVLICLIAIW